MTAHLLDTNHASPLVTRGHPLQQRVRERLAVNDTMAVCVPVLTETLFGIGLLPRALQNQAEWARFRPLLACYIPNEADGESAATLQLALRRQGRQLATVDALIAAVALRYDLTLLTTDHDFRAKPTLRQEDWVTTP